MATKKPTKIMIDCQAWHNSESYPAVHGFCQDCISYEDDYGIYFKLNQCCQEGHREYLKNMGIEEEGPPFKWNFPLELTQLKDRLQSEGFEVRDKFLHMCSKRTCFLPIYRRKLCRKHFKKRYKPLTCLFRMNDTSYWLLDKSGVTIFVP